MRLEDSLQEADEHWPPEDPEDPDDYCPRCSLPMSSREPRELCDECQEELRKSELKESET